MKLLTYIFLPFLNLAPADIIYTKEETVCVEGQPPVRNIEVSHIKGGAASLASNPIHATSNVCTNQGQTGRVGLGRSTGQSTVQSNIGQHTNNNQNSHKFSNKTRSSSNFIGNYSHHHQKKYFLNNES